MAGYIIMMMLPYGDKDKMAINLQTLATAFNTLRPRQNGRHFPDDIFKCIFLNENAWISITISLKFVPKGPINNIPALVQIMAWRRSGDKPLSELMIVSLLTHICVTRPQWGNYIKWLYLKWNFFEFHIRGSNWQFISCSSSCSNQHWFG